MEFAASATLVTGTRAKALAGHIVRATIVGITGFEALDSTLKLGVDLSAGFWLEERINLAPQHHPLVEGNWAVFGNDDGGIATHGRQPVAEFFRIGHGGR